jgi:ATP-dependent NAD(P)H-hydrate dehydratase
LTRTASRLCFAKYKRAMQTGEMLGYVGEAFERAFGTESVTDEATSGGSGEGVIEKLAGAIRGSL